MNVTNAKNVFGDVANGLLCYGKSLGRIGVREHPQLSRAVITGRITQVSSPRLPIALLVLRSLTNIIGRLHGTQVEIASGYVIQKVTVF